jgi:hypothetical protein
MKLTTKHLQLDRASDVRLAWITHALRNAMHMTPTQTRPTMILRRCLDLYAVHVERLLWPPAPPKGEDPRFPELRRSAEAARLRECGRDGDIGVPLEAVNALPVQPLSALNPRHAETLAMLARVDQRMKELGYGDDDDENAC